MKSKLFAAALALLVFAGGVATTNLGLTEVPQVQAQVAGNCVVAIYDDLDFKNVPWPQSIRLIDSRLVRAIVILHTQAGSQNRVELSGFMHWAFNYTGDGLLVTGYSGIPYSSGDDATRYFFSNDERQRLAIELPFGLADRAMASAHSDLFNIDTRLVNDFQIKLDEALAVDIGTC